MRTLQVSFLGAALRPRTRFVGFFALSITQPMLTFFHLKIDMMKGTLKEMPFLKVIFKFSVKNKKKYT